MAFNFIYFDEVTEFYPCNAINWYILCNAYPAAKTNRIESIYKLIVNHALQTKSFCLLSKWYFFLYKKIHLIEINSEKRSVYLTSGQNNKNPWIGRHVWLDHVANITSYQECTQYRCTVHLGKRSKFAWFSYPADYLKGICAQSWLYNGLIKNRRWFSLDSK